ncbi:nuclear transport factor 2 family protein [Pararhizobium sp.]|uniref:nuclear transport factor 2 family protein n=1 Tax=Pararhizobium sp. TaxID=1977563 RepID=UPI00271A4F52|nr:nuclear transport factor 2 family protein [Pararhizobium sp.]MDO9416415.1 nuclear transport factor 2 family protein [Pararhizobium sp.]
MSAPDTSPRSLADRQLIAYNAHDLDGFCALFANDAVLSDLATGRVIASGMAAIRAFYAERFSNPDLACTVHHKTELGDFAIDRETVTGLPGGPIDFIAIYEVRDGLIRTVRFVRSA